jgi:hypothetical protein
MIDGSLRSKNVAHSYFVAADCPFSEEDSASSLSRQTGVSPVFFPLKHFLSTLGESCCISCNN